LIVLAKDGSGTNTVLRHSRHGRPGNRGSIRISEEAVAEYLAACECATEPADVSPLRHIR
jgi:hypothetical protein